MGNIHRLELNKAISMSRFAQTRMYVQCETLPAVSWCQASPIPTQQCTSGKAS